MWPSNHVAGSVGGASGCVWGLQEGWHHPREPVSPGCTHVPCSRSVHFSPPCGDRCGTDSRLLEESGGPPKSSHALG